MSDERFIRAALQAHRGDFRPWECLPRPAVVAGIAEALQPNAESNVLEVGAGTGYLTAVLGTLAKRVVTFEIRSTFAAMARRALDDLPYANRITVIGATVLSGIWIGRHTTASLSTAVFVRFRQRCRTGLQTALQLIAREGSGFSTRILGSGGFSPLRGKYVFASTLLIAVALLPPMASAQSVADRAVQHFGGRRVSQVQKKYDATTAGLQQYLRESGVRRFHR